MNRLGNRERRGYVTPSNPPRWDTVCGGEGEWEGDSEGIWGQVSEPRLGVDGAFSTSDLEGIRCIWEDLLHPRQTRGW